MQGTITNTQSALPNSSASLAQAAQKKAGESKMDFLKLLTLQLKSQNPLKPYDNQEFAAQLAQFSQLEQLTGIRALLETQQSGLGVLTQAMSNSALPGMLGKNAKVVWDQTEFDGTNPVNLGYNLPAGAASGEITIKDARGKIVKTIDLKGLELSTGQHKILWDGKDDNGNTSDKGLYHFEVAVCDAEGKKLPNEQYAFGKIQAVRFAADGARIVINGAEVPIANIADISID